MVFKFVRTSQKSFANLALILIVTLRGSETQIDVSNQWVVWNVGQGSWITRIENRHCIHFDAGGEGRFPYNIVRTCRNFKNSIVISHSDWDHVSFIQRLLGEFPDLCREGPFGKKPSKVIANIPECSQKPWWTWRPFTKSKRTNDQSSVYFYKRLLYPGDSPKKFEKFWRHILPGEPTFLVLAHHGSRTGTSKKLLEHLQPKLAIASARKMRYGHPHPKVESILRQARIPLLRTEVWGNIHLLDKVSP